MKQGTGFSSLGNAERHWLVRLASGRNAHYVEGAINPVAATPARTTWALSDTCPELAPAIARFELREQMEFINDPSVPDTDRVWIGTYDVPSISFWAQLHPPGGHIEINLLTSYDDSSGVAVWVRDTVNAIRHCFTSTLPNMPYSAPVGPAPPFSIFGDNDNN